MTDYDEKPQALRYRPTPGGLLLNLTRLIQVGVGLFAVFVPAFLMAQNPDSNPAVQDSSFTCFIICGIVAWVLPMFKLCSSVPWPVAPGPEALMALIAGMFSAISGICICIARNEMTENNFYIAMALNVLNTTILFGTPVIICSNHAVRLFFTGDTDLTTMQAFSNMEARAKWAKDEQKRMSEKAKYVQKPRYELVETNDGNAFKMAKKTGQTPESTP